MALIDSHAYFRPNPPCPAFWGVAPPKMKMALIDSHAYFRPNPSGHASGVTPPKMKLALIDSQADCRIKPSCPAFWGVAPRSMEARCPQLFNPLFQTQWDSSIRRFCPPF
jgi:hypothetical protein